MADRVCAAITLGGTISASVFADLVGLIGEAALSVEWGGEPFDPSQLEAGEPLALYAHEVAGGQFIDLEEFCVDHEIAFAHWSGSCPGAFAAERVVFTGRGESRSYVADEEDRVLLARDTAQLLGSFDAVLAYYDEAEFAVPPLIVIGRQGLKNRAARRARWAAARGHGIFISCLFRH